MSPDRKKSTSPAKKSPRKESPLKDKFSNFNRDALLGESERRQNVSERMKDYGRFLKYDGVAHLKPEMKKIYRKEAEKLKKKAAEQKEKRKSTLESFDGMSPVSLDRGVDLTLEDSKIMSM